MLFRTYKDFSKPNIYKSCLTIHTINTVYELLDTYHIKTMIKLWENFDIYKHKANNELIDREAKKHKKYITMFKTLSIQNKFDTRQKYHKMVVEVQTKKIITTAEAKIVQSTPLED